MSNEKKNRQIATAIMYPTVILGIVSFFGFFVAAFNEKWPLTIGLLILLLSLSAVFGYLYDEV